MYSNQLNSNIKKEDQSQQTKPQRKSHITKNQDNSSSNQVNLKWFHPTKKEMN